MLAHSLLGGEIVGADLVSICVVHRNGPVSTEEVEKATKYINDLHREVSELDVEIYCSMIPEDTPLDEIILLVADAEGISTEEAIEEIKSRTENPEELLTPFLPKSTVRDMSGRPWNGDMIYYAGEMTWGDEPEGIGYQSLKWICLLGVDGVLGLE